MFTIKSVFKSIFPHDSIIIADWVSDTLILPHGKLVKYVHMGYASEYERYSLIVVVKGNITSIAEYSNIDYQKYRQAKFEEYKKSKEYKDYLDSMRIRKEDTTTIDEFFKEFNF